MSPGSGDSVVACPVMPPASSATCSSWWLHHVGCGRRYAVVQYLRKPPELADLAVVSGSDPRRRACGSSRTPRVPVEVALVDNRGRLGSRRGRCGGRRGRTRRRVLAALRRRDRGGVFSIVALPRWSARTSCSPSPLCSRHHRGTLVPALRPSQANVPGGGRLVGRAVWTCTARLAPPRDRAVGRPGRAPRVVGSSRPDPVARGPRESDRGRRCPVRPKLWKFAATYAVARFAVGTERELVVCLKISLAVAVVVSVIGIRSRSTCPMSRPSSGPTTRRTATSRPWSAAAAIDAGPAVPRPTC